MPTLNEQLAAIAAKARAWAQVRADKDAGLRVRLAKPLSGPAIPKAVAEILSQGEAFPGGAHPKQPWAPTLEGLQRQVSACQNCGLGGKRRKLVFGEGSSTAPLFFVGDAPGPEEDASGRPFAGAAGDLLDRMVAAMGFKRGEVYLSTLLKCRLQGRDPEPGELEACRPILQQQLELVKPKVLIGLGNSAATALGGGGKPLSELRGRWLQHRSIPLMLTYHPNDLLRDPGLKRHVWDDLKLVMKRLHA